MIKPDNTIKNCLKACDKNQPCSCKNREVTITENDMTIIELLTVDEIISRFKHLLTDEELEEINNYKKIK